MLVGHSPHLCSAGQAIGRVPGTDALRVVGVLGAGRLLRRCKVKLLLFAESRLGQTRPFDVGFAFQGAGCNPAGSTGNPTPTRRPCSWGASPVLSPQWPAMFV